MQASNAPTKVPLPFANAGAKNAIPTASQIGVTPGAASLTDGFPPLTRTPVAAGGVPPSGQDMNGILNLLSANIQWENAGAFFPYDATFSTAISGYPKGALLAKAANNGFWLNTADNNTTNPDTGGAGWVDPLAGRLLKTTVFATAGASTFTPLAATNAVDVEVVGGGGGGGACGATTSGQVSAGSGGAGGGYARKFLTTGFSGVAVTVGAGGVAAASSGGGPGGTSSFGSLVSATGGTGGNLGPGASPTTNSLAGGAVGGSGSGGDINGIGGYGQPAFYAATPVSGKGGSTLFGEGAFFVSSTNVGQVGLSPGSGGSGASSLGGGSSNSGGVGHQGIVIVREYA
ncbi:hypothetical protein AX768_09255 [Burkholderia sp. PAMC 28687]|uniref:glycine-rich domain-containing protein n=1 Tax=Burkholderia sp. PAMC 28687 TaxID=1795874 RepID=UPI000783BB77|nr:hypothetical protein [Burkholderia sp. PAMC 28687]AMM14255.1 hypothetical protein AX768_09255 [Burkholderia sp. PAMC 28687]